MPELLAWLAEQVGLDVPPDADLSVVLGAFPAGGAAVLALGALLASGPFAWWCYRNHGHRVGLGMRLVLMLLRAVGLLLLGLVLFEPQLVWPHRDTRPGETLVLVDCSASMAQRDVASSAGAGGAEGDGMVGSMDRLAAAVKQLTKDDAARLRELARANRVRVFGYGARLQSVGMLPWSPEGLAADASEVLAVAEALHGLRAEQDATDPGEALQGALRQLGSNPVAGVLWWTDGRRNRGDLWSDVGQRSERYGVATCLAVALGGEAEPGALRITSVDAPDRVFVGDPLDVVVRFRVAGGAAEGSRGVLYRKRSVGIQTPERDPKAGAWEEVASLPLPAGGDAGVLLFSADAIPSMVQQDPGLTDWRVRLQPPGAHDDESKSGGDDALFTLEAISEQVRVLLLAGGPSPEYRAVRNLLLRDDSTRLSCWLQSAADGFPQDGDEGARLESLPLGAEALADFDVLLLMDPDPSKVPPGFAEDAARLVAEEGMGIWWCAGELFALPSLAAGGPLEPLAELLPVVPDRAVAERQVYGLRRGFPEPWPWVGAPGGSAGIGGPVVQWQGEVDAAVGDPWAGLPGFYLSMPVARLKSGAAALLLHGDPARTTANGRPMPVVAAHNAGAGRVLFCGSDETYRWRSVGRGPWQAYWVRGMRWLHEARLAAGKGPLRIRLGADRIRLGDPVPVEVEAFTPERLPLDQANLELLWQPPVASGAEVAPRPWRVPSIPSAAGRYRGAFVPDQVGLWKLASPSGDVAATVRVVAPPTEPEGPVDLAGIRAGVGEAGLVLRWLPGTPEGEAALDEALGQVLSRSVTRVDLQRASLWDNGVVLGTLVLLFGLEWILRKKVNLL